MIQAGLNPTAQQQAKNMETYQANKQATDAQIAAHQAEIDATKQSVAANQQGIQEVAQTTKQRFSDLATWYVKGETTVRFEVGDSALSEEYGQDIKTLANQALTYNGFVIEVRGYADSTGKLEDNQQLSKERAQAVVAYLLQNCHVRQRTLLRRARWVRRILQHQTRPRTDELKTAGSILSSLSTRALLAPAEINRPFFSPKDGGADWDASVRVFTPEAGPALCIRRLRFHWHSARPIWSTAQGAFLRVRSRSSILI